MKIQHYWKKLRRFYGKIKVGNGKQHRRKVRDYKLEDRASKHSEKRIALEEAIKDIEDNFGTFIKDFLNSLKEEKKED